MNNLTDRIEQLSPAQRERLAERLNGSRAAALAADQRLVAYVVCDSEDERTVERLREALREKLPAYMLPSAVVTLDALPLTPNGKVDRQALPEPEQVNAAAAAEFVPPRTQAEEALARIWGEVLGVELVGVHDNFFELGGHSLLVTQVISRVREDFAVELPLRTLFEAPTIDDFALVLEEKLIAELAELDDDEIALLD